MRQNVVAWLLALSDRAVQEAKNDPGYNFPLWRNAFIFQGLAHDIAAYRDPWPQLRTWMQLL